MIRVAWVLAAALVAGGALAADAGHHHANGPRDGRYLGVAVFESLGLKIPCVLDLTVMQHGPDAQYERRRAFLKLLPGGPASGEAILQYYDRVLYSFEKQTLQLVDAGQDLAASLTVRGDKLEGTVRSVLGRTRGRLTLQLLTSDAEEPDPDEPGEEEPIVGRFPDGGSRLPWLAALGAEWEGTCGEDRIQLQVQTGRGDGPLGLALGASLGRWQTACSFDGNATWCWQATYHGGTWNPFLASGANLRWNGPRQALSCRVGAQGASCEHAGRRCELGRPALKEATAKFYRRLQHAKMDAEARRALPDLPAPEDLQGRFWGLLHHEASDRYQPVELNIDAFYDTENPHKGIEILEVAAEATLYFGSDRDGDRAVARFDTRPFQNTFPDFTFSGHGDALFRVLRWRRGTMRGVWYSKSFGRIGTVELVRGEPPRELPKVALVPALSGSYRGPRWQFTLRALPQTAMHGWDALDVQGSTLNLAGGPLAGPIVRRGAYDFFTGRVTLETDGYLITGAVTANGLELSWPIEPTSPGLTPLFPYEPGKYLREEAK